MVGAVAGPVPGAGERGTADAGSSGGEGSSGGRGTADESGTAGRRGTTPVAPLPRAGPSGGVIARGCGGSSGCLRLARAAGSGVAGGPMAGGAAAPGGLARPGGGAGPAGLASVTTGRAGGTSAQPRPRRSRSSASGGSPAMRSWRARIARA
jgi:hypothetical protein